jgi:hypothetical protein
MATHTKGDFTHETASPSPLHFKHSPQWKRQSPSKFASHYSWGTTGVRECKMAVNSTWIPYMASEWIMFHGHLDCFSKPPLGGRPYTKPGDHGTPNAHNHWFILFYHVWGHAWIDIHWNSIWLRARPHMASHYTWRSVTTLHDLGGVLGWPLDTSFLLGSHKSMVTALGWIDIHWNSIWLRARLHMASHYTRGSVTTLHDVGGVLHSPTLGAHAHGFWVGMCAILFGMGGHRFCASLHPAPNRSQISRM